MKDKSLLFRRTVATIVSFVLCVSLAALTVCAVIGVACTEKYIKHVLKNSDYSSIAYSTLMKELEDITIPSGLPTDFFNERINLQIFEDRIYDAAASNLSNGSPEFTLETINKEFYDMLHEYALTQNRVIGDEAEESLHGFAEECTERYIRFANPSSVKFVLTNTYIVKKFISFGAVIFAALGIIAALILYFLCRNKDFIKHFSFALLGASLLSGVLPAILLFSKEIRNIAITAEALYSLTVHFLEGILTLAIIFAIVYFAVVLLALIIRAVVLKVKKTFQP